MAIVRTDDKHYKAIADMLRVKTGETDKCTPEEMPSFIEHAVDRGYQFGREDGKQVNHLNFWTQYLDHDGQHMFAGKGWNDNTFDPPSGTVIKPVNTYMMFSGTGITDLVRLCEEKNVVIDFSGATTAQYIFHTTYNLTHVGEIDLTNTKSIVSLCNGAYVLHTIDKLILKDDGSQIFTTPLASCPELVNLTIEGKIGQDGFDVKSSKKLSYDSLMSIINALFDYSGTTTTKVVTLGADNKNKLTEAEIAEATQKGWSVV